MKSAINSNLEKKEHMTELESSVFCVLNVSANWQNGRIVKLPKTIIPAITSTANPRFLNIVFIVIWIGVDILVSSFHQNQSKSSISFMKKYDRNESFMEIYYG